jgi:hypothetical protein
LVDPPNSLVRRAKSRKKPERGLHRTSPVNDSAAMVLTLAERQLLGRVSIPFGTSILCAARKSQAPTDHDETCAA